MITQIFLGSIMLGLCSAAHILILLIAIAVLKRIDRNFQTEFLLLKTGAFLGTAFFAVVLAHTVQVWSWAAALLSLGALPNLSDALYFSIVTYTTLGYGDVTLSQDFRLFAAMAAVTGLLNFGLSTAFLVGLFARMLPDSTTD